MATAQLAGRGEPRVFFPNLDGLRFCAFFLVYLQHGFALGDLGDVGVSFFFVLSGFLITYLILTEVETAGRVDVVAFYIRRILRIWPLYYAVILFGFVIYPALKRAAGFPGYIDTGNPLLYFFFLGNFEVMKLGSGGGAMSTNITWSVCIEEQFYLTWPLLFLVVPSRFYKYIFLAIIGTSLLFRATYIDDGQALYFHTLSVISDMAVGGLAAYLARNSTGFLQFLAGLPRAVLLGAYSVGLLLVVFRVDLSQAREVRIFERLLVSLFFAFIVLEQNYCHSSVVKMSRLKRITKLGQYTYGLYLLHPIAMLATDHGRRLTGATSELLIVKMATGLIGFALSVGIASASYKYYERPFLRLKGRFTRIMSGSAAASGPLMIRLLPSGSSMPNSELDCEPAPN